ncbi:HEPN domain-containing protein [Fusobacterium sp.]|uniref:HEPN domain-containing protein n=1 Tax=Fusobacterium sp. TaxID=68766 RepID=UPI00396CD360
MLKKPLENLSEYYLEKSKEDSSAADLLLKNRYYSQAIYLECQSMEKKIKSEIYKRINPHNKYYTNISHTHSLSELMEFLIDVSVGDMSTREQMKKQTNELLKKIDYMRLNNTLRYPVYDKWKKCYKEICYTEKEYKEIVEEKYGQLRRYIEEIFKAI